jgi:glycosyltransferase involved in cell wall biosynthesis
MVNSSGIGTCIKGWLPLLISENPEWHFVLLGKPSELFGFVWSHTSNVTVRRFEPPIYSLREQWEWLRLRDCGFDLLWVPHMNIPLFWRGKLLVTVHDVVFLAMPVFYGRMKRAYAKFFFRRIRNRADGIFFVSKFTQDEFARLVKAPKCIVAVIHNGVDETWFKPQPDIAFLNEIAEPPYIVAVGNVKPHKNLPRLIEAFGLIIDQIPHRLVIIGKNDGFLTCDSQAKGLAAKFGERVWFTGHITDDELRVLIAKATLLVQPSLYEGFGLPPLEAMAAGCPAAVSRAASLPEICGNAAVYFSPVDKMEIAEAIIKTITNKALAQKLIFDGRNQAKLYTWKISTTKLQILIKNILHKEIKNILHKDLMKG